MDRIIDYIAMFVGAISLILALVLMVSILNRHVQRPHSRTLMVGCLFAFAVFLTMSDPIDLGAGGIHDLRSLLIGTATALLSPIVGLMTLVTGLVTRWTVGGPGMIPGTVAMITTFLGAMLWRWFVRDSRMSKWQSSALLGVFISFHLVGFFFFPFEVWSTLMPKLAPVYVIANVFGAILIRYLLTGELSFLSEAEASKIEANTDHLTGLLNRRGLDMIYPQLAAPEGQHRGRGLLYFDIDHFKSINDGHGHAVGDNVLRHVAELVSTNLRPDDVFARLGGDEFAIVLNRIDEIEARRIAERCRSLVAAGGFYLEDRTVPVSISMGAIWMLDHTEIDEILDQADKALYTAKARGRNKVVFAMDRPTFAHGLEAAAG